MRLAVPALPLRQDTHQPSAQKGNDAAYFYTAIYAQWGKRAEALDWLDTAMRLRDRWLVALKTDPAMDPLRNELRYQAIERALKFPD